MECRSSGEYPTYGCPVLTAELVGDARGERALRRLTCIMRLSIAPSYCPGQTLGWVSRKMLEKSTANRLSESTVKSLHTERT